MSYLLEFCLSNPLPIGVDSPPYVVFGIHGTEITSSFPPRIPLKLVIHFAPALQKWVLPTPDPKYLPYPDAEQSLRLPHVGIDILAPIDTVGLAWIIVRMLQLSGRKPTKETFSVNPNLATSLAIHNAWLALELPSEGLRGLHTHMRAQLMLSSPSVGLWDMRTLWDAFAHDSAIVKAMGLNFVEALVGLEYEMNESLEILVWLQSTPELFAFFKSLLDVVPANAERALEMAFAAEEKGNGFRKGYQTSGKDGGRAVKSVARDIVAQVDIMERCVTRKVSPQERSERETSDFQAMQWRLRRTKSDDSLRSVETAIWDPQQRDEVMEEEKDESVNNDMHDPGNHYGGLFSDDLARTFESIQMKRSIRRLKNKPSTSFSAEELTTANLQLHNVGEQVVSTTYSPRNRRSSSATTYGKEHRLLHCQLGENADPERDAK